MGESIPIVGGLLGGLMGGTPKSPPLTPMVETPPPPTVDSAREAADAQAAADKRQGRLSTIFTPSGTSSDLATNTATTFSKKLLGQ